MVGKIQRLDFSGSSNIGAFCRATDHWVIQALSTAPTERELQALFGMPTIKTTVGHSTLVGILVAGNRNGLLVPHIVLDEELDQLRKALTCPVTPLKSRLTALGNLILTNDHAAIVSKGFSKVELQVIRDTLGVEVEARKVAGSDLVGSYCVVTNRGLLAHTGVSEDDLAELGSFFGVNTGVGTINCGVPYVSIGLVAASHAAGAGFETTGPELMRITETFFPD
jgi:translation initiation factor 6